MRFNIIEGRIRGTPFAVTFGSQGEVIARTVFVQSQEKETILDTYLAMLCGRLTSMGFGISNVIGISNILGNLKCGYLWHSERNVRSILER